MARLAPRCAWIIGLIALGAAGCSSHSTSANSNTPLSTAGSGGADLVGAAQSMGAASSFAFSADVGVSGQVIHVTGRFSAPGDLDEILTGTGGPQTEVVFKNGRAFTRQGPSGPFTAGASSATAPVTDPRQPFTILTRAKGVAAIPGGYRFSLTGSDAQLLSGSPGTTITGQVMIANGRIDSLIYDSNGSRPLHVVLVYRDIGTSPAVTAPPGA